MSRQAWIVRGENSDQRVLFISPKEDEDGFYIGKFRGRYSELALGIVMLASELEVSLGFSFDSAVLMDEGGIGRLCEGTIVGIQSHLNNYHNAVYFARLAKASGAIAVIMGGPYASSRSEQILRNQESVDIVVSGHGEAPLSYLIRNDGCVAHDKAPEGVIWRPTPESISDVSSAFYPLSRRAVPNRGLWPIDEAKNTLWGRPYTMVCFTSGCFKALRKPCEFCSITHPPLLSKRTAKQAGDELIQLPDNCVVEDGGDDFAASSIGEQALSWINRLSQVVATIDKGLSFYMHGRVRSFVQPGVLESLSKLGVVVIQIGIESANPETKALLGKGSTKEEDQLIATMKDLGMGLHASIVIGHRGETLDTAKKTAGRLLEICDTGIVKTVQMDPLTPLPGSEAFDLVSSINPSWKFADFVSKRDLLSAWLDEFCRLSVDDFLELREQTLHQLPDVCIGSCFTSNPK